MSDQSELISPYFSIEKYLDFVGVLLIIIAPDQTVKLVNKKACMVLGYEEQEIVGRNWFDHFLPERVKSESKKGFAKVLTGERFPYEYVENLVLTKSGEERIIAWHNILLSDETGNIIGTMSSGEDITERKRMEGALRESEKKYRQVVENAQEMIHTTDINGKFTYANSVALRVTGYSLTEFLQLDFLDLIHPDQRQRLSEIYVNQFREKKATIYVEFAMVSKTGEVRWIGQNSSLIMEGKKVVGFHSVARDITERKQAEEALREAEEQFRLLFEKSTDAILIRDREGIIRLANPTALKILKASRPEEIIGKAYLDFVHPDDRPGSIERIQRQIRAALGEYGVDRNHTVAPLREHQLIALDGDVLEVESTGVAFYHQGEIFIQGIFHDLTERKQMEKALRESEKEAKRLAQENTIMAEIGRIMSSTLDIQEVYERFAGEVRKLIQFDRIAVNTIDPADHSFAIAYVSGSDIPEFRAGKILPLPGTPAEEIMRTRLSLLIQEKNLGEIVGRFPVLEPILHGKLRSLIMVPLISKNEVIGLLNIQSVKPNAYTAMDLKLAEKVATQIAGAIANSKLFFERRRAEDALKESEERYRNVFEQSRDAIYLSTKGGKVLDCNQATLDLFGYSREEMLSLDVRKIYANPDDRRQFQRKIEQKGSLKEYEVKFLKKDGTEMDCLLTATLRHDKDGGVAGYQGIIRDVTERKRLEEEREKLIRELQEALAKVKTLSGLLPICASCKKIRDDKGYWNQIEAYVHEHSEAKFSHSICPDCLVKLYPEFYPPHPKGSEK